MAHKKKVTGPGKSAPFIDIGIPDKDREKIADGLSRVLADTYGLYLKSHSFHWNVEGPMFNTLHLMFMEQYTELWNAVDPVAERIRSLGHPAPGSYAQFGRLSSIEDVPETPPAALAEEAQLLQALARRAEPEKWLAVIERTLEAEVQLDRYIQVGLVLEGLLDAWGHLLDRT